MSSNKTTPRELWARQRIDCLDVNYTLWNKERQSVQELARMSRSCIFTVDVFKERYDFASDNFSYLFGYNPARISTIRKQGDLLEERIHPDDRAQLMEFQIEHGQFIYSLPPACRNDYRQTFQFRMLNAKGQYVNVITRQHVIRKDKKGKAWIILGAMDISPDQILSEKVKRSVMNLKTGEISVPGFMPAEGHLTRRETEILGWIRRGFLSKEIADKLNLSIYTINNHRKNILTKLNAGNIIEAINTARKYGMID